MPDKLKGKEVLLVYIDENGFCRTLDHDVERVDADSYIKFTTRHFWQRAVKRTETLQNPKMKQVGNKESTGTDKKIAVRNEIFLKKFPESTWRKDQRVVI